jgi:hypothetical protein
MTCARQKQAGKGVAALLEAGRRARLQALSQARVGGRIRVLPRTPGHGPARALQEAQIPRPAQAPAPFPVPPRFLLLPVLLPRGRIRGYPPVQQPFRHRPEVRQRGGTLQASRPVLPAAARIGPRQAAGIGLRMVGPVVRARGVRGLSAVRVPMRGVAWTFQSAAFRASVLVREPSSSQIALISGKCNGNLLVGPWVAD